MTINWKTKYGAIQKACHLHNGIFHPIQLCHTLSNLVHHFPCVIHKVSLRNYRLREKIFCIYVYIYIERERETERDRDRESINNPHCHIDIINHSGKRLQPNLRRNHVYQKFTFGYYQKSIFKRWPTDNCNFRIHLSKMII